MRCSTGSVFCCLLIATAAAAAPPPPLPKQRLDYTNAFVVRLNPLGIQDILEVGYRRRLYTSEEPLWRTGQVGFSIVPTFSPALLKLGFQGEIEPLAILKLQARWEWIQYFGNLDHLQSFPTVDGDYSDTAIKDGGDAGQNYDTQGWQAMFTAELRGRVGPVVARSRLQGYYTNMTVRAGDTVWYDPYFDLLSPAKGWTIINDADLFAYLLDDRLLVGLRHTLLHAFFEGDALGAEGESDVPGYPTNRLGPLVAWHVYDDPGAHLARITLFFLMQWHITHPTRAGQDVSQGIPYVAIGCSLSGDIARDL